MSTPNSLDNPLLESNEAKLDSSTEKQVDSGESSDSTQHVTDSYTILPALNEDLPLAYDYFKNHFENFVFEGGGIRGIAFGGVVYYLEKHGLREHIKRFAGSSAGSIVAAGLSVGYTGPEIIQLLHDTDFDSFKDAPWGALGDVYRFWTKYGVYKGDAFEAWFEKVLEKKTGNGNITLLEVYQIYGKELAITGTCLNTHDTVYFHYSKYPHMPVKKAVRISMSIPIFFASVRIGDKVMVDGGMLNNYPIWIFDGPTIGDPHVTDEEICCSKTIGFKLMTDAEKQDYQLYHVDEKINGLIDFATALINSMLIQIERGHIRTGYWKKTVCINTHNVGSLEFKLPLDTMQKLIQTGYDSVHSKMLEIQKDLVQEKMKDVHTEIKHRPGTGIEYQGAKKIIDASGASGASGSSGTPSASCKFGSCTETHDTTQKLAHTQ